MLDAFGTHAWLNSEPPRKRAVRAADRLQSSRVTVLRVGGAERQLPAVQHENGEKGTHPE